MESAEKVQVVGVVRRRRNLSSLLSFMDVEEKGSGERVQLVIDGWECSREITCGLSIEAEGKWEMRGESRRLVVERDGIMVVAAREIEFNNPWAIASMHAQWRKESGAQCSCSDPLCARIHVEQRARWKERREILSNMNQTIIASSSSSSEAPEVRDTSEGEEGEGEGEGEGGAHPSNLASKARHNRIFGEFLLDTYGAEWLRDNGGICEVAGGRGMLAEQLMLEHDIPVTLIEPRPMRLNRTSRKRIRKWLRKHSMPVPDDVSKLSPVRQHTEEFYGMAQASIEVQESLRRAAVIVGMHPDQATGAVVEAANALDKPFAVVPCCVFSRKFPDRRTPEGEPVALYEDLVAYLHRSREGTRRSELPFEGRNVVLFRER